MSRFVVREYAVNGFTIIRKTDTKNYSRAYYIDGERMIITYTTKYDANGHRRTCATVGIFDERGYECANACVCGNDSEVVKDAINAAIDNAAYNMEHGFIEAACECIRAYGAMQICSEQHRVNETRY